MCCGTGTGVNMPSKYPSTTSREVLNVLQKIGFYEVSQKGSHKKLTDGIHVVIVPMHNDLAKGTLKSILAQADIDIDEFLDLR